MAITESKNVIPAARAKRISIGHHDGPSVQSGTLPCLYHEKNKHIVSPIV